MLQLSPWQRRLASAAAIVVGNALYSLAVALFVEPAGLITGGATGIALAVNKVVGLPTSGVLLTINLVMLALGWAVFGRAFALNTLASSLLSPVFLELWERLLGDWVLTDDIFLCTVFSGIGIGAALGVVIHSGASTGGMDIPPLVLQKYLRIPVSSSMLVFDLLILLAQAAFSPAEQALYGIVMVIIYTVVLDKTLLLGTTCTEVKIISPKSAEILSAILSQLDRGVTVLHGEGGYQHGQEAVLLSVISRRELPRMERIVHEIDPACFMIVSHVTEVSGRGFSVAKDYH